jgi:DNA gyrase subunit B
MLYRLLPSLIRAGKVYIAETPLYEINTKDDTFFAYNDREKEQIISRLGDKKFTIQRSKGLGENDPEMMSRTTMHPATRKLIRITPEDEQKTYEMFDILLGDNLEGRKLFIAEKGPKYLALADV